MTYTGSSAGPFAWQLGNPLAQAVIEDLAREFGFTGTSQCNTGAQQRSQKRAANFAGMWAEAIGAASLPLDIEEQDAQYTLVADVPGLQKSDLKVIISNVESSILPEISAVRQCMLL